MEGSARTFVFRASHFPPDLGVVSRRRSRRHLGLRHSILDCGVQSRIGAAGGAVRAFRAASDNGSLQDRVSATDACPSARHASGTRYERGDALWRGDALCWRESVRGALRSEWSSVHATSYTHMNCPTRRASVIPVMSGGFPPLWYPRRRTPPRECSFSLSDPSSQAGAVCLDSPAGAPWFHRHNSTRDAGLPWPARTGTPGR